MPIFSLKNQERVGYTVLIVGLYDHSGSADRLKEARRRRKELGKLEQDALLIGFTADEFAEIKREAKFIYRNWRRGE